MDKTVRGRAQTEKGNKCGGATKKREISRTLLSINLHFLVHVTGMKLLRRSSQQHSAEISRLLGRHCSWESDNGCPRPSAAADVLSLSDGNKLGEVGDRFGTYLCVDCTHFPCFSGHNQFTNANFTTPITQASKSSWKTGDCVSPILCAVCMSGFFSSAYLDEVEGKAYVLSAF